MPINTIFAPIPSPDMDRRRFWGTRTSIPPWLISLSLLPSHPPSSTIIPAFPPILLFFVNSFFPVIFLSLSIYHRMITLFLNQNPRYSCLHTHRVRSQSGSGMHWGIFPGTARIDLWTSWIWILNISQFTILFSLQYDVPREGQAGVPLLQKRWKAQNRIL